MFYKKSHYFFLPLICCFVHANTPAAKPSEEEVFLTSAAFGAAHGLVNQLPAYLHYKSEKEGFFAPSIVYQMATGCLADGVQTAYLNKKFPSASPDLTSLSIPALLGHGCAQALVESYNMQTGTIDGIPLNFPLLLAIIKCSRILLRTEFP